MGHGHGNLILIIVGEGDIKIELAIEQIGIHQDIGMLRIKMETDNDMIAGEIKLTAIGTQVEREVISL